MDPSALTVYESPFPKKRIGKDNDGGYVIADVPGLYYKLCLAGGVSDDISFEEEFCRLFPDAKCFAYDGTIFQPPPIHHPNLQFVRQNIGPRNHPQFTNLHGLLESQDNIFVKMDIEGGEIPWLLSLDSTHLNNVSQMVIEFHNPFSMAEAIVFDKINRTHVLVHFHPNNCCGTRVVEGVTVPNTFECTYLHKKYFSSEPVLNRTPIPSPIDMRNVVTMDDITLTGPPFVH